jgi:hypothetical protein
LLDALPQSSTFGVLKPLLSTELARMERVIEADLPRVNAMLRTAGQPEIVCSKAEAPVATSAPAPVL